MNVFIGHSGVDCVPAPQSIVIRPPKRAALVRLQNERKLLGQDLIRIQMTQEESSALMMDLEQGEFREWMQFSTILGIPFSIVSEEALCYQI